MSDKRLVRVTKPHTENGVTTYPGGEVLLDKEDAEWLCNSVVAERVEIANAAAKVPGTPEFELKKNGKNAA